MSPVPDDADPDVDVDVDATSLVLTLTEDGSPATTTQPSPTIRCKDFFDSPDGSDQGALLRCGQLCFDVGSNPPIPIASHRGSFQRAETRSRQWTTPIVHSATHRDLQDDRSTQSTHRQDDTVRVPMFAITPLSRLLHPSPVETAGVSSQVSPPGNFESLLSAVEVMMEDEFLLASTTERPNPPAPASRCDGRPSPRGPGGSNKRRLAAAIPVSSDSATTKRPRPNPERAIAGTSATSTRRRPRSHQRDGKPSIVRPSPDQHSSTSNVVQSKRCKSCVQHLPKVTHPMPGAAQASEADASSSRATQLRTPPELIAASAETAAQLACSILAHHPAQARSLWVYLVISNFPSDAAESDREWQWGKVPGGFVWSDYPPLERVLRESAQRYYEVSHRHNQSQRQSDYYHSLVDEVRAAARRSGCGLEGFDDRQLRSRIRFYYKTQLQNAKKRFHTLLQIHRALAGTGTAAAGTNAAVTAKAAAAQHRLARLLPVLRNLTSAARSSAGVPLPAAAPSAKVAAATSPLARPQQRRGRATRGGASARRGPASS